MARSYGYDYAPTRRCYEGHPPLVIGEFKIWGGSCITPVVTDADIYVGFDFGMRKDDRAYPWVEGDSFLFPIADMGVPANLTQFTKLLEYLWANLEAGKKIHIGCIGGHGRTGMVLAALVTMMTGEKDSIAYVRANYCPKAVESKAQVDWLAKHFGITPAQPTKQGNIVDDWLKTGPKSRGVTPAVNPPPKVNRTQSAPAKSKAAAGVASPPPDGALIRGPLSLWGADAKLV